VQAKIEEKFEATLLELQYENIDAWDYVNAIPYETWA
jgi:hypothetical protein